jgi:hypothetical protein
MPPNAILDCDELQEFFPFSDKNFPSTMFFTSKGLLFGQYSINDV